MDHFPLPRRAPADFIDGRWVDLAGPNGQDAHASHDGRDARSTAVITSVNPAAPDEIIWRGVPQVAHVDAAVAAARRAFPAWAALPAAERHQFLRRYQQVVKSNLERVAGLICEESGKTMAESRFEASALIAKVDITLDPAGAWSRITDFEVPVSATRRGINRFKPHGVMAVIGPFNFPAHLPNGHFVPALAAGNTIVFKPSDKTPAVGQLIAELWEEVGLPPGVFNLVQGAADVAARLVSHDDLDGILFTGSWPVGRRILEANLDRPGRIIALEMGGNNAAAVMEDADLRQAVIECVRAAFATTGQRCTCTRRVIVHERIIDRFRRAFVEAARSLTIGPGRSEPAVFMGPVINEQAVATVLDFQRRLVARGGKVLLEAKRAEGGSDAPSQRIARTGETPMLRSRGHFISPGIVEVDGSQYRAGDGEHDCEVFGPLVRLSACRDLDDAIAQANATQYGLAAAIFTQRTGDAERFLREVRAGCINWNTGTAGASSKLAFGGLGRSGNHRPAGAFSVDYCAYPVASMVESSAQAEIPPGMAFDDAWLK